MQRGGLSAGWVGVVAMLVSATAWGAERTEVDSAIIAFREAFPQAGLSQRAGQVTAVYGQALAVGETPEQTGERFRVDRAALLGAKSEDLAAGGSLFDGQHTLPIMLDPDTGDFEFVLVYFSQQRSGTPVFRSDLRVLVRNEPGYPAVLASSSLKNLGDFELPALRLPQGFGQDQARALIPGLVSFSESQPVIWAGLGDRQVEPRLAVTFRAGDDDSLRARQQDWIFVVDAATGEVLYQEDQILLVEVQGNVSGMATPPGGADDCAAEVLMPLPYVEVSLGTNATFADANGDYTIDGIEATVVAGLAGEWFNVFNSAGFDDLEGAPASTPADIVFNEDNFFEVDRAQVNGYVESNRVRDFVLQYSPGYPSLDIGNFSVTVNRTGGLCPGNAWYNGTINFCLSGSGFPNTAFSSVIYHEYGHHLVSRGGSGQGQYGEGMSDVVSVLILDDSRLGLGFSGSCSSALRNANNTLQYPCDSNVFGIHSCGRLISGCVWDTRNALLLTNPSTYIDILSNLAINAIFLHNGTEITPQIAVDYLTLDDNDGNIFNGTPHYDEICQGFGLHNMDCPTLIALVFNYPTGRPLTVTPDLATTIPVNVNASAAAPTSGTGQLHYSVDGGGFITLAMSETAPNQYDAVIPALACGGRVNWYVSSDSDQGVLTNPLNAPAETYEFFVAVDTVTPMADDFETNQGWTTEILGATAGAWERAVPVADPAWPFAPSQDGDGSGQCFLTDNRAGNSDVDGGAVRLISPQIDMSTGNVTISYLYYLTLGSPIDADDFLRLEINSNDGVGSWTLLVNQTIDTQDAWALQVIEPTALDAAGVSLTSTMRLRFTASDGASGGIVEAAVDGLEVTSFSCVSLIPPTVISAVSRVTHGAIADFDVDLLGPAPIEPRAEGVTKIVVNFDLAMEASTVTTANVSIVGINSGTYGGSVAAALGGSNDELTLTFDPSLPNVDRYTVDLTGMTAANGGPALANPTFEVIALHGDVDQTGTVTTGDASAVRFFFSQAANGSNFLFDVNNSGGITTGDFSEVRFFFNDTAP